MHVDWLMILLRVIHVLTGILWVGAAVFVARFLVPAVRGAGPAAGPVMQQLIQRGLPAYMPTLAIFTVLSGFGLYWRDSGGFRLHEWLGSGTGRTFGLGGIIGLVVLIYGAVIVSPAAKRMGALGARMREAGGAPAPELAAEMQRTQAQLGRGSAIAASLLVIAALCMAVARYV